MQYDYPEAWFRSGGQELWPGLYIPTVAYMIFIIVYRNSISVIPMKQLTSCNRAAGYLNKVFDLLNEAFFESHNHYHTVHAQSIQTLLPAGRYLGIEVGRHPRAQHRSRYPTIIVADFKSFCNLREASVPGQVTQNCFRF